MTTSEVSSSIGFFLTLIGLMSTFFYIHLSNWFRDILELKSKFEQSSVGNDDRKTNAIIECSFEIKKLFNHVPLLVSIIISGFILLLTILAFRMINSFDPRPLVFDYYEIAISWFVFGYLSLTLYFLSHGYFLALRLKNDINKKVSEL
jgi:hypothetical protein